MRFDLEAETDKKRATIGFTNVLSKTHFYLEAQKLQDVARIKIEQQIMEKESEKKMKKLEGNP